MSDSRHRSSKRSNKHPSMEVDFNGTARRIPSYSSFDSDNNSEGEASGYSPTATVADGSATSNGASKDQQQTTEQHKGLKHHRRKDDEQHITAQEWGNMALLVLLYAMQGIPLGLTMGAM